MFDKIEIFDDKWDSIVKTFPNYEVYYLSGYCKGFKIHGDGEPILLYYRDKLIEGICVLMLRDISDISFYSKHISKQLYFDTTTPYGYGGFIFKGKISEESISDFYREYLYFNQQNNIISCFTRFNPLTKNSHYFSSQNFTFNIGHTIDIELVSSENVWDNLCSKNRNMIRKAKKNDIKIIHGRNAKFLTLFKDIYDKTMENDNASDYYFFSNDYYNTIINYLPNNYEVFLAQSNDTYVSAAIILFANNVMHYHLSGTLSEYRHLAPNNLLLYEVSIWGIENNMTKFHLGGGLGAKNDNLLKFKKSFNKKSENSFYIGKEVFNFEVYDSLVNLRLELDSAFQNESNYFPLYRDKI